MTEVLVGEAIVSALRSLADEIEARRAVGGKGGTPRPALFAGPERAAASLSFAAACGALRGSPTEPDAGVARRASGAGGGVPHCVIHQESMEEQ